ncbi:MAG: AraC family transcriptional regulator ligand-binding domain-containing protein [Boseongicola sp.]
MTRSFTVDLGWAALMNALKLRATDVLRAAELPEDLFARTRPTLSADKFTSLWDALATAMETDAPGLTIGRAVTAEMFSPPLFAAFCSPDLTIATARLAQYKPLVGPLILESHPMAGGLELTFAPEPGIVLPNEFIAAELVFLVQMARLALRDEVRPIAVEMQTPPASAAYAEFFGHRIRTGPFDRVVFSPEVARRPFVSANPALFAAFEPDLQLRLGELAQDSTVSDRVRATLMEALPSGRGDVANTASQLGMSSRSLQRKLGAEGTSFQTELQNLRTRLATSYLNGTEHSSAEISFMLGYDDPNSFIRAFHDWTGTTPEAMRKHG